MVSARNHRKLNWRKKSRETGKRQRRGVSRRRRAQKQDLEKEGEEETTEGRVQRQEVRWVNLFKFI